MAVMIGALVNITVVQATHGTFTFGGPIVAKMFDEVRKNTIINHYQVLFMNV